jgi:hypothetical protein
VFFFFILALLGLLDPDPLSECGSGSRLPSECGSGSETLLLTIRNVKTKTQNMFYLTIGAGMRKAYGIHRVNHLPVESSQHLLP